MTALGSVRFYRDTGRTALGLDVRSIAAAIR